MYRKITIICFLLISTLENKQKTVYLLFFCTLSYFITFQNQPFMVKRLNVLEEEANLSVLCTIFSGSLYILEISDIVKAVSFVCILIINVRFLIIWFLPVFNIYMMVYGKKIFRYCPRFVNFVALLQKTSNMTKINALYLVNFSKNLMENSKAFAVKAM